MEYNVLYLEDLDWESVVHDLKQSGLKAFHCQPTKFMETITSINDSKPDLILTDFRLMERGGDVNAPSFAQYYRSLAIDHPESCIPIVLLSNDDKIHGYYQDYTSHDLFDFAIEKERFHKELPKYTSLLKELIVTYRGIKGVQSKEKDLVHLLDIPKDVASNIDPRVYEELLNDKSIKNVYMASRFLLDDIVKPIGILVGEDVLSARLGVSISSPGWLELCQEFKEYKFTGCYSSTYNRWWSVGIENWWKKTFENSSSLKRLSGNERLTIIRDKFNGIELNGIINGDTRTWTICKDTISPLAATNGYELKSELNTSPWIEPNYLSYGAVRVLGAEKLINLKELDIKRYKAKARGE